MNVDMCKHCLCRGNLEKCKSTKCFQHNSWYVKEQQKIIDKLQKEVDKAKDTNTSCQCSKCQKAADEYGQEIANIHGHDRIVNDF